MNFRILTLLTILLLSANSFSQEMKITGTVVDTNGTTPIKNAVAMAVRMRDSLLLGFTRTDENGFFELKGIQMDTFALTISYPKNDDKIYFVFGKPDNLVINIPSIILPGTAQEIEEVVILAYKDPIYYKGDTLVYVADSFKVGENAVVEDLLKKLPGIEVDKDGKIKSQGQDITKVLVDGDEFFGSDPTIATKNLGAKGVESVQIYEKEDEGQFGSDEKIKVLDLKLKDDAKKGYFGRVSGATDFALMNGNAFYEGELLLNRFDGSQKISVFALTTNTPRSNFGWGDVNKFGLDNEQPSGNRWMGGNTTNTNGIPQTLRAGLYFSDKFGKKKNGKIGFNYSYYNTQLNASTASRSQYFLTDTTYFTDDSTHNFNRNESHRFNINFETNLDSLTMIYVRPGMTYDLNNTDNNSISQFIGSDNTLSLATFANTKNKSTGLNLDAQAGIERKFMKPKRLWEFDYYINLTDNKTDGNLYTNSTFYNNPSLDTTVDQSRTNYNKALEQNFYTAYTEPIGKFFKIQVGYNLELSKLNQDKKTYDLNGEEYTDFNATLSNIFETNRMENRGGFKFQFEKPKHLAFIRLDGRNITIENINEITGNNINQNVNNFLPSARYEFKPSQSKRMTIDYTTSSELPSINALQPIADISNPNRITVGNPDLVPNYNHQVNIFFNSWHALSGRYTWAGANASVTNNDFASSSNYDMFGRTISQTVNVDGNAYASVYAGGGIPFWKRQFTFQPNGNAFYNRVTNLVNGQENITNYFNISAGLELRLQMDSIEFSIGNQYTYTDPRSSLSSVSNTPYSTQNYNVRFMWRLPLGFKLETDGEYTINGQRADGYNINIFIWNAEISKSFLKTENLVLSIIGKDMLNQNVNAQRQVNGNIVTDNRTKIISRYFLMKLTFRFNNNKTKETDNNGWF